MNDSEEGEKENFYNRPSTIIQGRPKKNIIILMIDFHAKIGGDNRGYEEIMKKQGLRELNESG
ncbi:hypothetical protein DPMN_187191 [Dreissena polymorpha]|uniref:Uncharacterized protein n=1 Tax=Dreissena polymorpha TaxID=45954 RepID=A0A9D4DQI4_DREPO|nr:hypothetical protein DPMN_187191 [Dreissena polymorpha]